MISHNRKLSMVKYMKKYMFVMLAMVSVIGFIASSFWADGGNILSVKAEESYRPQAVDLTGREDFGWGINVHSKAWATYPEIYLEEQINLVAKSGSTWIRMNGDIYADEEDWKYLDTAVGLANKYGLKIIMVVEPSIDLGLDYITLAMETLATRYNGEKGRGFVDVFQPWNETDVTLMRAKYGSSSASGTSPDHYFTISIEGLADLPEYLEYFKAAKQGLVNAGNKSKMMVNFCYTHWGCAKYYLEHGLEIDMLGMDLYSSFPYDLELSAKDISGACDSLYEDVVKEYNIPVIVAETNLHMGYVTQEDRENPTLDTYDALIDMMYIYYDQPWIKGLIFYELLDETNRSSDNQEAWFGLVTCDAHGVIGEPKPIYTEIQRLLKGNNDLPVISRDAVDLKPYEELVVGTADDSNLNDDISAGNTTGDDDFTGNEIGLNFGGITDSEINEDNKSQTKEAEETINENTVNPVKDMIIRKTTKKFPWLSGAIILGVVLVGVGIYDALRKCNENHACV